MKSTKKKTPRKTSSSRRKDQRGGTHLMIPIIAVLVVASIGTYILSRSFAYTSQSAQIILPDDGNDDDSSAQPLMSAGTAARQVPSHKFYHLDGGQKRLENSVRGLDDAKSKGYKWIDLDAQYVWTDSTKKSRTMINTHWGTIGRECFVDPQGKIPLTTAWSDLTLDQAERLQSGAGKPKSIPKDAKTDENECNRIGNPYSVRPMTDMIKLAAQRGLSVEFEVKGGGAFNYPSNYKDEYAIAQQMYNKYGTSVWVKTLDTLGGGVPSALDRLKAAHDAGFKTLFLNHANHVVTLTKSQSAYVDYWRGAGASNAVKENN